MTHCIRCHRPLKRPTETGMGPVCARRAPAPLPAEERGLFGYDIAKASEAARQRVAVHIEMAALDAHMALRRAFRQARVQLGVWAA